MKIKQLTKKKLKFETILVFGQLIWVVGSHKGNQSIKSAENPVLFDKSILSLPVQRG